MVVVVVLVLVMLVGRNAPTVPRKSDHFCPRHPPRTDWWCFGVFACILWYENPPSVVTKKLVTTNWVIVHLLYNKTGPRILRLNVPTTKYKRSSNTGLECARFLRKFSVVISTQYLCKCMKMHFADPRCKALRANVHGVDKGENRDLQLERGARNLLRRG